MISPLHDFGPQKSHRGPRFLGTPVEDAPDVCPTRDGNRYRFPIPPGHALAVAPRVVTVRRDVDGDGTPDLAKTYRVDHEPVAFVVVLGLIEILNPTVIYVVGGDEPDVDALAVGRAVLRNATDARFLPDRA